MQEGRTHVFPSVLDMQNQLYNSKYGHLSEFAVVTLDLVKAKPIYHLNTMCFEIGDDGETGMPRAQMEVTNSLLRD